MPRTSTTRPIRRQRSSQWPRSMNIHAEITPRFMVVGNAAPMPYPLRPESTAPFGGGTNGSVEEPTSFDIANRPAAHTAAASSMRPTRAKWRRTSWLKNPRTAATRNPIWQMLTMPETSQRQHTGEQRADERYRSSHRGSLPAQARAPQGSVDLDRSRAKTTEEPAWNIDVSAARHCASAAGATVDGEVFGIGDAGRAESRSTMPGPHVHYLGNRML